MRAVVLTTLTALLVVGALAQSEGEYQTWMKTIGSTVGDLNKNIAAKNGAAAASDAEKLEATFKEVEGFWKQRGAEDAVTFAMNAQTDAAAIGKAASADNMDDAAAQVKKLQANCGGCHKAHREGTRGSYTIK